MLNADFKAEPYLDELKTSGFNLTRVFSGTYREVPGSFNIREDNPSLADPNRPVWILENGYPKLLGPGITTKNLNRQPTAGAQAAQTDTFQFGAVNPGDTKAADWRVTPVRTGTYTVHYEVAAGLEGKAKAVTGSGGPVKGQFVVTISGKPPRTCVNGAGKVVKGTCQPQ